MLREQVEDPRSALRLGTVIDGQPDGALRGVKMGENFPVPGQLRLESRIQPRKSCAAQAAARSRPRIARTPKTAANRPASTKSSCFHRLRSVQIVQRRMSIKRHSRVCVPARSKLSRKYLKCVIPLPAIRAG